VKPFDPFTDSGTGWTFGRPAVSGLTIALGNAIWTYQEFKKSWTGIEQCGMSQDLSCDNAAQQYEGVLLAAKNT
jgi:starch synthase